MWEPVTLILPKRSAVTGKRIWGDVMRRKVKGVWQYRERTKAEAQDQFADSQW